MSKNPAVIHPGSATRYAFPGGRVQAAYDYTYKLALLVALKGEPPSWTSILPGEAHPSLTVWDSCFSQTDGSRPHATMDPQAFKQFMRSVAQVLGQPQWEEMKNDTRH